MYSLFVSSNLYSIDIETAKEINLNVFLMKENKKKTTLLLQL